MKRRAGVGLAALACLVSTPALGEERARDNGSGGSFRAHEALGVPWLRFSLQHRLRFEHLRNDFRPATTGHASVLSLRTLLSAELRLASLVAGVELQDGRVAHASEAALVNNTIVNPVDLLQAYAGLRHEGLFDLGDVFSLSVGRFTMDVGSRRLLSRNEFPNAANAFTGVDARWTSPAQHSLRVFAVMPVQRLPTDAAALEDNRLERDRENPHAILWGVFFGSAPLAGGVQGRDE
jgi:hypothetical protein